MCITHLHMDDALLRQCLAVYVHHDGILQEHVRDFLYSVLHTLYAMQSKGFSIH